MRFPKKKKGIEYGFKEKHRHPLPNSQNHLLSLREKTTKRPELRLLFLKTHTHQVRVIEHGKKNPKKPVQQFDREFKQKKKKEKRLGAIRKKKTWKGLFLFFFCMRNEKKQSSKCTSSKFWKPKELQATEREREKALLLKERKSGRGGGKKKEELGGSTRRLYESEVDACLSAIFFFFSFSLFFFLFLQAINTNLRSGFVLTA